MALFGNLLAQPGGHVTITLADQGNIEIAAVFGRLSFDDLVARLRAAGIAYGAINSVAELSRHPQLRRLDIDTPSGPLQVVAPPARVAGRQIETARVPALDQQGAAIRKEFGE